MTLSKEKLLALIVIGFLVLFLPIALFISRKNQDIRPRALMGAASFKLNGDKSNAMVGDTINVSISMEISDQQVAASGVDFTLLFDNTKLHLTGITPLTQTGSTARFDTVVLNTFNNQTQTNTCNSTESGYNCVRIALVSKNKTLVSGTVVNGVYSIPLATATFTVAQGATGQASIKFPSDNSKLQVVGNNKSQ
jgi:hypothetical protein